MCKHSVDEMRKTSKRSDTSPNSSRRLLGLG